MNIMSNYITLYSQNLVKEILNLVDGANQEIPGKIVKINGQQLVIDIGSQTVVAKNQSSFSFKEGDEILLSSPVYQDGKFIFRIVKFQIEENKTDQKTNSNNNLDSIAAKSKNDIVKGILNKIGKLIELPETDNFIYIEKSKIPGSLMEFAERNEVFLGTATVKREDEIEKLIIKVGDQTFETENDPGIFSLQGKVKEAKTFMGDENLFLFVFNKEKGLAVIPQKNLIFNQEFKNFLLSIFSHTQIEPREEKDFLTILSLILARKSITKEEFVKEKAELTKFVENLREVFARKPQVFSLDNENLTVGTKEGFFLFKLLAKEDGAFEQKIAQVLNDLRFNQKETIQFDFGNLYLNIFNFRLDVNNNPFELQFFVNKKKGNSTKASSVMIRINTQTLGCVGIYVKKVLQNTFKAVIFSDRLSTLKLIESSADELVKALKERGYKLEIDCKLKDTSSTAAMLEFLVFETSIQKIDMKV
ncbi:hypothetical protein [Caldicellulosiruptor morganii]|uniref:Flagellar hook-length control protein-like C-terminal domain-containing protein n=1 Tax=Caldicellulosiruptor morganii TaxID=1387555 RepID=A0ABY7BSK3_9FIRM|nr:hypothetical protein [Caldicellulosiruptor morganii]WAM34731.1 hypothetical protein OTK00_000976 [Caldicellulosiruptor morganii]